MKVPPQEICGQGGGRTTDLELCCKLCNGMNGFYSVVFDIFDGKLEIVEDCVSVL